MRGMDFERAKKRLEGCYITVPTMFRDPNLELDLAATRRNVRFLLDNGITEKYGTLLSRRRRRRLFGHDLRRAPEGGGSRGEQIRREAAGMPWARRRPARSS